MGGLTGRILLAVLVVMIASRRLLLRLFLVPGLVVVPAHVRLAVPGAAGPFVYGLFLCGLWTVAQFSYFGEYLPKAFPLHLRGTGGSFATNVGGRMIGTSASLVTASWSRRSVPGDTFIQVATGAAITGTAVFLWGLAASAWLPEPAEEEANLPVATSLSTMDEGTGGPRNESPYAAGVCSRANLPAVQRPGIFSLRHWGMV